MADEFKPGDTVQLKSGGPFMTVERVVPNPADRPGPLVACCWFGDHGQRPLESSFRIEMLRHVKPA